MKTGKPSVKRGRPSTKSAVNTKENIVDTQTSVIDQGSIILQGFSALLEGIKNLSETQLQVVSMIKEIKKNTEAEEIKEFESIYKDKEIKFVYNVFPLNGYIVGSSGLQEEDVDFTNRMAFNTEQEAHNAGKTYYGGQYKIVVSEKF